MDAQKLNLKVFHYFVAKGASSKKPNIAVLFMQIAATIATHVPLGFYSSRKLDEALERVSSSLFPKQGHITPHRKQGALHVVSETYETGGHTKVLESLIQSSSSGPSTVFFTRRSSPSRALLEMSLEGRVKIKYSQGSLIKRAFMLREAASKASEITLHTHMDDVVPSLALSSNFPNERIVRFNHADHRFWVGANLASLTLETRTWGSKFSKEFRSTYNSAVVGIPGSLVGQCACGQFPGSNLRESLGIPVNNVVLLTVGNDSKYAPIQGQNFVGAVTEILKKRKEAVFVSIGGSRKTNKQWIKLKNLYPSRVLILPKVGRRELWDYYHEADIGLDSFPMSGGTVLQEMCFHGLPVIVRECSTGHLDSTYNLATYKTNDVDWIEEALSVIDFYSGDSQEARSERRTRLKDRQNNDLSRDLALGWEPEINALDLENYLKASMNRKAQMLCLFVAIFGFSLGNQSIQFRNSSE